jgi:hypothetical protein
VLLAVSFGQGALVSRLPATSGAASGLEALVSRALAPSMFSGYLTAVRLHSCFPSLPYCASLLRRRRVFPPSYPWTLVLRPRCTQLVWNAPGLASPSSLVEFGDQSDLKRLSPAFVAPLLYSSLRNVVNADLFFLLALQQACSEGIVNLHHPSYGCSVVPLHTGSPYSGYRSSWRNRRLGGTC